MCGGRVNIWKIVVPYSQLCCEPKVALKKEVFKLKKKICLEALGRL